MTSRMVKRGPRKKRRRTFCVLKCWQHCERCRIYTTTYPNKLTAFYAVPKLAADSSLMCINRFGGVHLAVA